MWADPTLESENSLAPCAQELLLKTDQEHVSLERFGVWRDESGRIGFARFYERSLRHIATLQPAQPDSVLEQVHIERWTNTLRQRLVQHRIQLEPITYYLTATNL